METTEKTYSPLTDADVKSIHSTALDVLEKIGMASPPAFFMETALGAGCMLNEQGRLCFPRELVEDIIARASRLDCRQARDPERSIDLSNRPVLYGHGGIAPMVIDFESGQYRDGLLTDLYDISRLVDRLEYVHVPGDSVIAADIKDPLQQDISKAYALISATTKSFALSMLDPKHIKPVTEMFDTVLGAEGRFRERPFCQVSACPTVSPMAYEDLQCSILVEAARQGYPVQIIVAAMAGTTAPTALAGTLVQTVAESLAALVLIELMVPGIPVIVGMWPFVSDLRSGAFSGGGGEEALVSAAAGQILNWYGLTGSVSGGITDAKLQDAQCGFEKGISAALTSVAGGGIVGETAGMMASLMAVSFEAMVIDNEMLGSIQRVLRGIEVTDETLSFQTIADTVDGAGNFLTHPQTLSLMKTEYTYPKLSDRKSIEEWREDGATDIRERARAEVQQILSSHYPEYIDPDTDKKLREQFPIQLPRETMQAGSGRW